MLQSLLTEILAPFDLNYAICDENVPRLYQNYVYVIQYYVAREKQVVKQITFLRMCHALHICIVAPEQIPVPPIIAGSVEICISALAEELVKRHEVTIISRSHPKLESITKRGKLTIIRLPYRHSYIDSVLKVIREGNYDLIQVDNRPQYAARIKSMMPSIPVSLFLHSLTFVTPPHITDSLAKACLNKIDLIIANSESLQRVLEYKFPECAPSIRKTILGVDTKTFRVPTDQEKQLYKRKYKLQHTFNVLFVGRFIPRKGIKVLVQAVHRLKSEIPNVRLIIAGGSPNKRYIRYMKRYAGHLRVPILYMGYVPHLQLPKTYWLGDCFVCPSQKHEAFGLVNVEAMASGVPVIASDIGGIKEIIRHGDNGLLVHQFQRPSHFSKYIYKIARNPDYAKSLRSSAHQDVMSRFTWKRAANRLEEIYSAFLKDR